MTCYKTNIFSNLVYCSVSLSTVYLVALKHKRITINKLYTTCLLKHRLTRT